MVSVRADIGECQICLEHYHGMHLHGLECDRCHREVSFHPVFLVLFVFFSIFYSEVTIGTELRMTPYPPQLSAPDAPDVKRRKLQARAPRRPQVQPSNAASGSGASGAGVNSSASSSTVLGAVGTTDELGYVSRLASFYCRNRRVVTVQNSQLRYSRLTTSRRF
jgi:hypothetical protein